MVWKAREGWAFPESLPVIGVGSYAGAVVTNWKEKNNNQKPSKKQKPNPTTKIQRGRGGEINRYLYFFFLSLFDVLSLVGTLV